MTQAMAQFTLGSRSTTKLKRITARMQKGVSDFHTKSFYGDRDVLRMIEIDIDIDKDHIHGNRHGHRDRYRHRDKY